MSNSKSTLGPWKFGSRNDSKLYTRNIAGADGYHVAAVSSRDDHEVDANARLIAAVPDLLEALQGLIALCHEAGFPCDKAEEAVNKATGETK